ncbi:hypothetical protein MUO32_20320 [Shinella sp. CPCC 101442]|uniref:hypothetical protein n=1 Tax=Shinella sp. CPCC 101442 TaxID=2932265 RepID=UPI0021531D6F|nr:hypothetical protein [Shinella sp. CPCC 101442]MCR6501384.1 hypothetical protein [Shinella sp. CPCC 101442]
MHRFKIIAFSVDTPRARFLSVSDFLKKLSGINLMISRFCKFTEFCVFCFSQDFCALVVPIAAVSQKVVPPVKSFEPLVGGLLRVVRRSQLVLSVTSRGAAPPWRTDHIFIKRLDEMINAPQVSIPSKASPANLEGGKACAVKSLLL